MTGKQSTIALAITGMSCDTCVRRVAEALRTVEGVVDARIDLQHGLATVSYEAASAPADRMIEAVADAGYQASLAQGEQPRDLTGEAGCLTSCCS